MRLADFLDANVEPILQTWEPFAATLLPAARHMDSRALRDHAAEILRAIAADIRTQQSAEQQDRKARGLVNRVFAAPNTAAQTHATLRAASGFTAPQLVAEYRALRASVLRLWLDTVVSLDGDLVSDMRRFNEAVDQAVAESVDHFTKEQDRWRNIFLGVLGHELRGPLDAILLTARLLTMAPDRLRSSDLVARMTRNGEWMKSLLDDLLDFNRGELGFGIKVQRQYIDMAAVCLQEIELRRAATPNASILFETQGDTWGHWDGERVRQVLGNLLSNALKYGDEHAPVSVQLHGSASDVVLSVRNAGPHLPPERLDRLFEPLHREPSANAQAERTSLGLGLYIVKAVADAHEAKVSATSSDGFNTFFVTWPKQGSSATT